MARVNLSLYGGVDTICTWRRSANDVNAPPPWEKIQLMSLKRCEVPLKIRLTMVRVVSAPNSTVDSPTPCTRLTQQLAPVGWVYTVALRRLSSSHTGASCG